MDGKPDNISFMIKRIKVHTMDALEDPNYRCKNSSFIMIISIATFMVILNLNNWFFSNP